MENEIVAPIDGTVTEVAVKPQAAVQIGDNLVTIDEG
jgi:biotin carboxyl carrier protein